MPTNLAIDDNLLDEALRIGGRRTKRETVNEALKEYVERLASPASRSSIANPPFTRKSDGRCS